MISFLRGRVLECEGEFATLDVNGVGYELNSSSSTLGEISHYQGSDDLVTLWVYTHVREDALQLFGFHDKTEKQVFLSLLKVNGVGPKMALKILSGTTLSNLIAMVEAGDTKGLSQLPKVGKKTAEQIILTLKGKLTAPENVKLGPASHRDDILSALVHLGYKEVHAAKVVEGLPPDIGVEDGVRRALSALTSI